MLRSGIRGGARAIAIATLSVLATSGARAQIGAQSLTRFVDVIEVSDHETEVDVAIQFNCSMRYVTHLPASEGGEVRIQLQPMADCGTSPFAQILGETPPVSD